MAALSLSRWSAWWLQTTLRHLRRQLMPLLRQRVCLPHHSPSPTSAGNADAPSRALIRRRHDAGGETVMAKGRRVRQTVVGPIRVAVVMAALQKMRIWGTAVALGQAIVTMEEMRVQVTMPLPLQVAISAETLVVRPRPMEAVVQLTAQTILWVLLRVLVQVPAHAMAAFPTL